MANLNLSQFGEKLFVADADHTFIWDTANAISKRVSRNSWLSGTTADFHLGLADAASPVAQTISVQSVVAGTTNTAGANLSINGSQGTGTGAGGSLLLRTAPAGSSGTAQNALVTAVAITSAGNVGIGTTAPGAKLDVYLNPANNFATEKIAFGNGITFANFNTGALTGFWLTNTGTPVAPNATNYSLLSNGSATILNTGADLYFGVNGSYKAIINSSGNVGIGTTSPTSKLHVASGATTILQAGTNAGIPYITAGDTAIYGDAIDSLELRRTSSSAQTIKLYGTYTASPLAYERLTISAPSSTNAIIGTERTGTGALARGLEFQTDGVTRMTINAAGTSVIFPSGIALQRTDGGGVIFDFTYNGVQFANTDGLGVSWSTITGPASSKHVGVYGYASEPGVVQVNSSVKGTLRDLRCRSVIEQPPASITPALNGDLVVEATSNTTLTFKLKGTDGTVRSGTITLA